MYHLMLARGHTGSFLADAMAGLDIALWDLKGRHYQAPLFDLAGGAHRMELPAYSSGLRAPGTAAKVELARKFCARGFAGVKLFTGAGIAAAEEEVRAVRDAMGPEAFLAVDAICKYDLAGARQLGRTLDTVRASWFEAPLNAEDVAGHAALAQTIATPIAVGETLRTPRQFEPWLRTRALAIAQPDLMRSGVTGTLRIAALAHAAHVPTTLHTGVCTGVGMAATWQLMAALPDELLQEHQDDLFATACEVLTAPLERKGGRLCVPARPGIGVEVDEAAVTRASIEHWRVDANGRKLERQGGPELQSRNSR
jgi:L-alanine-DL-glutamate epimerase-like enolase superfamily enzyme